MAGVILHCSSAQAPCSMGDTPDAIPSGHLGYNATNGTEYEAMSAIAPPLPNLYPGGEGIFQKLICPLEAGVTYSFNIDVTIVLSGGSAGPAYFMVSGANGPPTPSPIANNPNVYVNKDVLDSVLIDQTTWTTKTLTFTPTQDYTYIILSSAYGPPNNTYLGIDNMTNTTTTCGPTVTLIGDTICVGDTGTLTATGEAGVLDYTFEWTGGNLNATMDLQ